MGKKRIARLMQKAGIQGISRRRGFKTTTKDPAATPTADLVDRQFTVPAPNRLWVADLT